VTRQDILRTAREQFVTHGYALVTMSDIARATGGAVKTVYASVGTKSEILHELMLGDVAASRRHGLPSGAWLLPGTADPRHSAAGARSEGHSEWKCGSSRGDGPNRTWRTLEEAHR
jgi:AcrR family transcriptional regulator